MSTATTSRSVASPSATGAQSAEVSPVAWRSRAGGRAPGAPRAVGAPQRRVCSATAATSDSVRHGVGAVAGLDPGELDLGAGVHDDGEAGSLRTRGRVLVDDAELQPQRLDA